MKTSKIVLMLLMSMLCFGCEKEDKSSPEPKIRWESRITTTYNYSSGVLSGFTTYRHFTVNNNESGDITISASTDKSNKSCVYNVEPEKDYKLIIKSSISNPYGSSILTVSSSSSSSWTINFKDWEVMVSAISINIVN